jgi:hypothetical protein
MNGTQHVYLLNLLCIIVVVSSSALLRLHNNNDNKEIIGVHNYDGNFQLLRKTTRFAAATAAKSSEAKNAFFCFLQVSIWG